MEFWRQRKHSASPLHSTRVTVEQRAI